MKSGYVLRVKPEVDIQGLADEYQLLGADVLSVMVNICYISLEMEPDLVQQAGMDDRIESVGFDSLGEIESYAIVDPNLSVVRQGTWPADGTVLDGQTFQAWGLNRITQAELPLDGTYKYDTTASNVRVYAIDTGVNPHQELDWVSPSQMGRLVQGTSSWRAGNEELNGSRSSIVEINLHGGTTASIMAGANVGVARGVTLVAVKYGDIYTPSITALLEMFNWVIADKLASGQPAVANMSWGWRGPNGNDVEAGILSMKANGIAIVCAGGNARENGDNTAVPQRLNGMPNIVAVGAACSAHGGIEGRTMASVLPNAGTRKAYEAMSGGYDRLDAYSAYGLGVDVYAPSNVGCGATIPQYLNPATAHTFYNNSNLGTSFAAPHVAGIAALIYAENPTWTAQRVMEEVVARAVPDVLIVDPVDQPYIKGGQALLANTGVNLWGTTATSSFSGATYNDTAVSLPVNLAVATGNWYRYRVRDTSQPARILVAPEYSDWITVGVVVNNGGVQVDESVGLLEVNVDTGVNLAGVSASGSTTTGALTVIPVSAPQVSAWSAWEEQTTSSTTLSAWSAWESVTTTETFGVAGLVEVKVGGVWVAALVEVRAGGVWVPGALDVEPI